MKKSDCKSFFHRIFVYQLCQHMEPQYHQLELDLRLFLTWRDSGEGV
jgi:hypothetical protein